MYAIIEVGGHQYRVAEGEEVLVQLMPGEPGSEVSFDKVLLVSRDGSVSVGQPTIQGATVRGLLEAKVAGEKVVSYKYKRRKGQHCKKGHRQKYSLVRIEKIQA